MDGAPPLARPSFRGTAPVAAGGRGGPRRCPLADEVRGAKAHGDRRDALVLRPEGVGGPGHRLTSLGPVGGRIVAEVLIGIIRNDAQSRGARRRLDGLPPAWSDGAAAHGASMLEGIGA